MRSRLVLFAILLAGCRRAHTPAGPGHGQRAVPVKLQNLKLEPVQESSEYLATLSSRRSVAIRPQVSGPITRIFVKPGQQVAKGAPLLEIDPKRDQATLENLRALRNQRQSALTLAEQNFARAQKLRGPGVVSEQEFQTAKSALASARAELEAAEAQVAAQQAQLAYFRVSAPFAAVVGDIPVKVGDAVTPATPLTSLDQSTQLEAYVHVPLGRASDLGPQTVVELLDGSGAVMAREPVEFVSPEADPATQTLLLRIDFPNELALRAAQLVRARVIWSTHPGLLLPANAVVRLSGATFAYLARARDGGGEVAEQVPVELGDLHGNSYQVLSGLRPGEQVVVSGVQNLRPGAPIAVAPPHLARPAPADGRPAP